MSPKKKIKKQDAQTKGSHSKRVYLPRQGTLPARIFRWLNARPMLFAELSDNAKRETGLEGDKLASQLSAALYDLCAREVVIRINPATKKIIPTKNARGALYGLLPRVRAAYRASLSRSDSCAIGATNGAPRAAEPGQFDLSHFAGGAPGLDRGVQPQKPAGMPETTYESLVSQLHSAEKQAAAIHVLLESWT